MHRGRVKKYGRDHRSVIVNINVVILLQRMADHLKEKRDVGFFESMAGLMNSARVLDLDAFERVMKAEGLGVSSESNPTEANDEDAENTCKIFRFLQLLCEGHNLGQLKKSLLMKTFVYKHSVSEFQNYLRTQQGNTATVNLIICTVDYLLRLQESVMDFYWHYSSKEFVDAAVSWTQLLSIFVFRF